MSTAGRRRNRGPNQEQAGSSCNGAILSHFDWEDSSRQLKLLADEVQSLKLQMLNINGLVYPLAMRALLAAAVNSIGRTLRVPSRRKNLQSGGQQTWDRQVVLRAWQQYRHDPNSIPAISPADAAYLDDEETVEMALAAAGDLRAEARIFDETVFRTCCASTLLSTTLQAQIQKTFTFLYPSAPPLMFLVF